MKKLFLSFLIVLFLATSSFAAELIFLSDFETGNIQSPASNPDGWVEQTCYDYSFEPVTSPVRAGNYAIKIFLSQNDDYSCWTKRPEEPAVRARAQIYKDDPSATKLQYHVGKWLGYSVFMPEEWHATGSALIFEYFLCIKHNIDSDGTESIRNRWGTGPGTAPDDTAILYSSAYSKGEWVDWIIYCYPSWEGDGVLKVWRNGNLIVDKSGANCIEGVMGWCPPVFKLYKWDWLWTYTEYDELTIYFDEIRTANGAYTQEYYDLVDPAQGGPGLPTVTTQAVADITTITATGHGTITATGGENATKRGICWNITGNPTFANDKTIEDGNFSTGVFSGNMTGLTQDQHYYVKAYAYNTAGYGYGNQAEFDTEPSVNGTYIFDNGDNGTSSTGTWLTSGGANPYGTSSLYCHAVNSTYTYEKTLDGNYTVSLWWTEYASRSSSVTVKIYDSGDNLLDTKSVNQTTLGGQWNVQDTYDFNATAKVTILSTGGGPPNVSTCADAVKFDYVEGSGGEDVNNSSCLHGIHLHGCVLN